MEIVTYSFLLLSSICLTVGVINLRLWLGDRTRWELLAITCSYVSVAFYSLFEIALMKTESTVLYGEIMWWGHIPATVAIISIAWFLLVHLRTARLWLFWTIVGLRTSGLILNFLFPPNINFREITAIGQTTMLGQSLSYAIGIPNPLVLVNQLGLVLLFVFALDSVIGVWRRGDSRKALIFGCGVALFAVVTTAIALLVVWSEHGMPFVASTGFFFLLAAMAFELNLDMRNSERVAKNLRSELREKETILSLSIEELASIKRALDTSSIVAMTDHQGKINFVNEKFCQISGYSEAELLGQDHRLINSGHHPKEFIGDIWTTIISGEVWRGEIKNRAKNGSYYWVDTTIVPFKDTSGKVYQYVAIRHDITPRKLAEEEAHQLSSKLMNAQEKERARLARELHDDLSQSLALLSIQLQSLGRDGIDADSLRKEISSLTLQIQRLSSDVHRISHELHPAKLNQLGLAAALRGFCREFGNARGINIQFEAKDIPRDLPGDVALCLYRIAQESLQNVAKHSGASIVNVKLERTDGQIRLSVADNGGGFAASEATTHEALGLVSMQERVRSVNGTVTIDSVIGSGTKVVACAPMSKP